MISSCKESGDRQSISAVVINDHQACDQIVDSIYQDSVFWNVHSFRSEKEIRDLKAKLQENLYRSGKLKPDTNNEVFGVDLLSDDGMHTLQIEHDFMIWLNGAWASLEDLATQQLLRDQSAVFRKDRASGIAFFHQQNYTVFEPDSLGGFKLQGPLAIEMRVKNGQQEKSYPIGVLIGVIYVSEN